MSCLAHNRQWESIYLKADIGSGFERYVIMAQEIFDATRKWECPGCLNLFYSKTDYLCDDCRHD